MESNISLLRGWTSISAYEKGLFRFPRIKSSEGFYLYDENNNQYIDGKSQMMNVSFGHSVKAFKEAVLGQWDEVAFMPTMDGHGNPIAERFADKLLSILPPYFKSVYCSGSGTSSCEIAVQIARDYWLLKNREKKTKVISIQGGYHGNSTLMSEISEHGEFNKAYRLNDTATYIKLIQPYCYRCPLNLAYGKCSEKCADALKQQLEKIDLEEVGVIIFEAVQGNGVVQLPESYIRVLEDAAKQHDILLIADEVLTGFGRTGYDFAFLKYSLKPNIICLSKTLSNGLLPLGATVFDDKITSLLKERDIQIGSTQDGNPVCTALGSAVIDYFKAEDWSLRVQKLGDYFLGKLKSEVYDFPIVGDIRGSGLLLCIELVEDKTSKEPYLKMENIHNLFIHNGLFAFVESNYVVFVPPYIVDEKVIDDMVNICKRVFQLCLKG
ncbi:MAG: aminotransferase class III-fold pyridoxal phosphate-dependent enzyme [Clostridia bacterium]|nr:aminotransferase class III-fold pyridoxal phosphate-dependent enzyme [Clostridia bacterium]